MVTALVISFANVIFDVANSTFLPEIVDRDQLQSRNSLTSATHSATDLGGPSLGGLTVQVLGAVRRCWSTRSAIWSRPLLLRTLPARRAAQAPTAGRRWAR